MATKLTLVNARYALGPALGPSGEAQAFRARDTRTGGDVVLKVVAPGDDAARARLIGEFERLRALEHPALPEVVELGEVEAGSGLPAGGVFLATQRLDGADASERCRGLAPAARAREVARALFDASEALAAMHDAGLVHHDVKPAHLVATRDGHFRLIDLGLVRRRGSGDGAVHGTLAYLSPDALAGSTEPAVDLYALGATAYELLSGAPPYVATDPAGLLAAQAHPIRRPPGPSALVDLVLALLELDPARRPSHAMRVREELSRAGLVEDALDVRSLSRTERSLPFIASDTGRQASLTVLDDRLRRAAMVALVGPSGSGRSRVVTELFRRRAIAELRAGRTPDVLYGPTLVDAARELALPPEFLAAAAASEAPARARTALLARILEALGARGGTLHVAGGAPLVELAQLLDPARGAPTSARVIVELTEAEADALVREVGARLVTRVDLPALDADEVARLCEHVLGTRDDELVALAQRRSQGRPGPLLDLLRAARQRAATRAQRRPGDPGVTIADLRSAQVETLEEELRSAARALPPAGLEVLARLALLDRPVTLAELSRGAAPDPRPARVIAQLEHAGLVSWRGALIAAVSPTVAREALERLPSREALAHRLLAVADADGALLDAAVVASVVGAVDAEARVIAALRWPLDGARGAALLLSSVDERIGKLAARLEGPQGAHLHGELLLASAEYAPAIVRLEEAVAGLPPADAAPARLVLARALRLSGRRDDALRALAAVEELPAARALRARLLVDGGDGEGALRALRPSDTGLEALEVRALACVQRGLLDEARSAIAALGARLADAPPTRRARVEGLAGMIAQSEGALEEAARAYGRALALAEEGADLHGAAVYAQNFGGALRELGEHARAQQPLERAVQVLARVGRAEEHALAWFNLGNLHLSLGDLDAAAAAAGSAQALVAPGTRTAFFVALLNGDVDRRRGREGARRAVMLYEALRASAPASEVPLLDAALAETAAELDDHALAEGPLAALAAVRAADATTSPALQQHAALAEARTRLALDPDAPLPEPLAALLREESTEAVRTQRRDRALRLGLVLVRDALRRGAAQEARARLLATQSLFEEIRMRTPELRRAALADDPDVKRMLSLVDVIDRPAESASSRRLLEINKRLNSELDLDRLLELILDTVIELSRAERGFVLMTKPDGDLEIRMERNVEAGARAGAVAFSRSIADRAVAEGQAIVTVDAAGDQRFEAALSVTGLQLRSVLAVPLIVKGRAVGCVYVDHRARVGLFRPADVALVSDLAEQAAIAVENARLLAENRQRAEQIRTLNHELEERLASQTVELEGMHREVREARRVLGVRHDYAGLIGQTPRMLELFRLLDRVTDTHLPVVIYGESGTGKELVARALHHNGPRRKAAFVSESCGAIPESLLEAALFGHVRGAFTGAQSDRRGLFEIADGGTLFLDEVGEMSPAMQVRLLRVLQEGEFRRVGGERMHKVDVRIVVASNRDLGRLVTEGVFREDLYYRLNVVRVALPPLRERRGDVPLLVEHFLAAHPSTKGITRRALDRLAGYAWPGNIRQLENEIARACSLADGTIDLPDLSPQVQAGTDEADATGPEPLDLHERVERLERSLLQEALQRTGGNQSEAARLLGLSRFGLQKKLRRYHMPARTKVAR